MTLAERIARHNAKYPLCRCGTRHDGAAWTPNLGWHDAAPAIVSPFTRRAMAGTLPAAEIVR